MKVIRDHHTYWYAKVAIVVLPLIVLSILVNNERTDQRVSNLAHKVAAHDARAAALRQDLSEYVLNRSGCGLRRLAQDSIIAARTIVERSRAALNDPTANTAAKNRNRKALADAQNSIKRSTAFQQSQLTIPTDLDCSTLPKKPPTG